MGRRPLVTEYGKTKCVFLRRHNSSAEQCRENQDGRSHTTDGRSHTTKVHVSRKAIEWPFCASGGHSSHGRPLHSKPRWGGQAVKSSRLKIGQLPEVDTGRVRFPKLSRARECPECMDAFSPFRFGKKGGKKKRPWIQEKKVSAIRVAYRAHHDPAIRRGVWRTRFVFSALPEGETWR